MIGGAVNQDYTATQNGTYTVVVSNGSCDSPTSNLIVVGDVGIEELSFAKFITVSPNPTNGLIQINVNSGMNNKVDAMHVVNTLGQTIMVVDANATQVDLSGFEPGVYNLSIVFDQGSVNKRIIKN